MLRYWPLYVLLGILKVEERRSNICFDQINRIFSWYLRLLLPLILIQSLSPGPKLRMQLQIAFPGIALILLLRKILATIHLLSHLSFQLTVLKRLNV